MVSRKKILARALSAPANMSFKDLVSLVEAFGFALSRVNGSHHIYTHSDIPELVNIQNVKGKAKPYQIRQFLRLVERHNLRMEDEK